MRKLLLAQKSQRSLSGLKKVTHGLQVCIRLICDSEKDDFFSVIFKSGSALHMLSDNTSVNILSVCCNAATIKEITQSNTDRAVENPGRFPSLQFFLVLYSFLSSAAALTAFC